MNFDVCRGLRVEQAVFANGNAITQVVCAANGMIRAIENDIACLDLDAFAAGGNVIRQAIGSRLVNRHALRNRVGGTYGGWARGGRNGGWTRGWR